MKVTMTLERILFIALVSLSFASLVYAYSNQLATRTRLVADTTLYVAPTGCSTNGPGTSGSPFCTPQQAVDYATINYDFACHVVYVQIAAGAYAPTTLTGLPVGACGLPFVLVGNTTDPTKVVLDEVSASFGAQVVVRGVKFTSAGTCLGAGGVGSYIRLEAPFEVGTCGVYGIEATMGGVASIKSSYVISGGSQIHMSATVNGIIDMEGGPYTVTFVNAPNFSIFVRAGYGGVIDHKNTTFVGNISCSPGSFYRWRSNDNGAIHTETFKVNYFPGCTAGEAYQSGSFD